MWKDLASIGSNIASQSKFHYSDKGSIRDWLGSLKVFLAGPTKCVFGLSGILSSF